MHVKQAADAVRKRDQEGQGVPGHKEAPLPCHPPGLASLCCHPPPSPPSLHPSIHPFPSTASLPQTPLITSPYNNRPPPNTPRRSTCHPPLSPQPPPALPHPPPPFGHPSATLLAHAVVRLLGNELWTVYGGTHKHARARITALQWKEGAEREKDILTDGRTDRGTRERERERVVTSNKMLLYNPVLLIGPDTTTFSGNNDQVYGAH